MSENALAVAQPTYSQTGSRLDYAGTGGEMLGKLIVGAILCVITCGVYMPWFAIGLYKYVYSKTTMKTTSGQVLKLEFTGTGGQFFVIGLVGFLTRRNLITMFLCAEMMLQGVAINLVAVARYHGNLHGQVFVLFIVAVAACEASIALALVIMLYRRAKSLDSSEWQSLREVGVPPTVDTEPLPTVVEAEDAHLAPAGARPKPPATEEEAAHV